MPTTLTIHDETSSGHKTHSFTLVCLTERMTDDAKIKDETILRQITMK